jgi:hypothetical protein
VLDGIVCRVARARLRRPGLSDRIVRRILEALSRTGIPAGLYIRYQRNLAHRVGELIEAAAAAS